MRKKYFILLVFWWALFFPSLSFNNFTTDIIDDTISYHDLYSPEIRKEILEKSEYDLWIKTILFSNK